MPIIIIIREIKQHIQNWYGFSRSWVLGTLASHQQLPGSTRKSHTGLSSRWELDSGMHGSESGSGSQAGQGAGSSSEASHEQIERDPRDPPILNWVWRAWHGIPSWSISGHLFRPSLSASMTLYDSFFEGPKRSIGDHGGYCNSYKHGPFLPSIRTISSVKI